MNSPQLRNRVADREEVVAVRAISVDEGHVTATITGLGDPFRLEYHYPFAVEAPDADALLAACIVPAMRAKRSLVVDAPISISLATSAGAFQRKIVGWFPEHSVVEIHAAASVARTPGEDGGKVACFFTGGVDSFYSVLKHRDEIDELIFVDGYELSLNTPRLRSMVSASLRSAARELGIPLVEVRCNLRRFADRHASWLVYHGAALASIGLAAGRYKKVLIPSTHSYETLIPYGSHPLLDPLWTTETTEIVHDGADATRPDKIATLAQHDVPLRWLRSCFTNGEEHYNCGRCEKCLRTMIALDLAGVLDRTRTFPSRVSLRQVGRMRVADDDKAAFLRENIVALRHRGGRRTLALVLRGVLLRRRLRSTAATWKRKLAGWGA